MHKILSILMTAYKNYIVYIPDIIGINIIIVIRLLVIITLYKYLYGNFSSNNLLFGYNLTQMTYAVIIAQIVSTGKPKVIDEISQDVKSGKVGIYLLNPINYILFKFLEFFPIFMQNVFFGLIFGLSLGFFILGTFPITLAGFFGGLILLIGSMLVVFFSYCFIGILAFYTEDVEAFRLIYSKLDMVLGGNLLPIPFLPGIIQTIAYASPFAYFGYTSGLILTSFNYYTFLKYLSIQMFWLIFTIFACFLLFNRAKYKITINGG